MHSSGGYHNQWPGGQPPQNNDLNQGQFPNGQFFSPHPRAGLPHSSNQTVTGHAYQDVNYVSPYGSQPQPQVPTSGVDFQEGPAPLDAPAFSEPNFATISLPIVEEGYIPAPGHEDDDAGIENPYTTNRAPYWESDEEEEDDDDWEKDLEEEDFLRSLAERNNDSDDSDFSIEDEEEDPDDLILDGVVDDDAEETRKRGRPRSSGRGRGTGRGRPRGRPRLLTRNNDGSTGVRPKRVKIRRGMNGRPKGKRGPREVADPGPEFKDLQRRANDAYEASQYQQAIVYAKQAIKKNPEIYASHNLLSEVYDKMGQFDKALEVLIVSAPVKRDKSLWGYIIDKLYAMDTRRFPLYTEKNKDCIALDCLRGILELDSNDLKARHMKLDIEERLGHHSKCVKQCQLILVLQPERGDILKRMAMQGTATQRLTRIHLNKMLEYFDTSFAYMMANEAPQESNLDWSLLNVYLDLLNLSNVYPKALTRARMLSRWIQGRKEETYWDDYADDREFDLAAEPRRTAVPQFSLVSDQYNYGGGLPLDIRIKIGLFRLRQSPAQLEEAMRHFEYLEPEDESPTAKVNSFGDLFREIADAFHSLQFDQEAVRFYEPLYTRNQKEMVLKTFLGLHTCYSNLDKLSMSNKAADIVQIFLDWKTDSVKDLAVLAKFFEHQGMTEEARKRADRAYKMRGFRALQQVGFRGLSEVQAHGMREKRRANWDSTRKAVRIRKYLKTLREATRSGTDPDNDSSSTVAIVSRPKLGLFRKKKTDVDPKPRRFEPVAEPATFAGTDVPTEAVASRAWRLKLDDLAQESPEDLQAARTQHREIEASFSRLRMLQEAADDGDEDAASEFLSITRELLEEFSTFDLFYYNKKHKFRSYFRRVAHGELWKDSALMMLAVAANRVEDGQEEPDLQETPRTQPNDFYGIHFDEWLDAFCMYAILLARNTEDNRCFRALDILTRTNIFYWSQKSTHQIQKVRLACALALDDSTQVSVAIRWFMRTYPFSSDLFRLYGSANRLTTLGEGFGASAATKAFMRYIKAMDYALLTPAQRDRYNFQGDDRTKWYANAVQSGIIKAVKGHDPALFGLFGHMEGCTGSSHITALNYFYRAFALTPEDPTLNLSIGIAYIQHAMKRLSENRQFQIQQGLTFVYRYHELRTRDNIPVYCSEAEYNLGRVWHSLGLLSDAIPHYEKCIALSKRVREQEILSQGGDGSTAEDFASDAAFTLQQIYALTGNFSSAKTVTEGTLVIE
ncbi:hypothetical protein BDV96DRAFT_536558 [Lophiotrema nucula]|uniref:TPR-like protein n=1 Tax=Lophiotrema nucula TaxID=690887 RepID=A0A6A5ZPT9_9PLEO|nr:hypothetical protein BDV96DRAFT_536558 [Lophiotrema nucula]